MTKTILAIESSCDDSSAAIFIDGELVILGVSSQKIHKKYGGVIPELASRAHQQEIVPVVDYVIKESGLTPKDVDAVAFTRGPGLLGSLLVGTNFAKSFALAGDLPLIAVNHMEAHILAHMIEKPKPEFPFICLTVSGGHTQIVLVKSPFDFEIIGETLDDAAGEAFDKTGKLIGLEYPAGPLIDKLAQKGQAIYPFPIPKVDGYNFSFSGLKTAIRNFIIREKKKSENFIENHLNDICASVQKSIVEILILKIEAAAKEYGVERIAIAGGVSANSGLREELKALCNRNTWKYFIPKFAYCTDNAAMIGVAAYFKLQKNEFVDQEITPDPKLKINQ